jgi:hypothetical protein
MWWFGYDIPLGTLANWLEVIGFFITLGTLIAAWLIGSEIQKLKTSHLLDKTLPLHVKRLNAIATALNSMTLSYQGNERAIRSKLQELRAELTAIVNKLGWIEGWPVRMFLWDVRARCNGRLVNGPARHPSSHQKFFPWLSSPRDSSFEDILDIYSEVHHTRRAIEIIITDRRNTLRL